MQESRATLSIGGGCYTTSWTTLSTVWANCQVMNDKGDKSDSRDQQKKQQYTKYKVITRADITVSNTHRIIFNGRILTIEAVSNPTNRGRMLEIRCVEEVI